MEICEEGHDPIVWVRKSNAQLCPVCEAKKEVEEWKEKAEAYQEEADVLAGEVRGE